MFVCVFIRRVINIRYTTNTKTLPSDYVDECTKEDYSFTFDNEDVDMSAENECE